MGLGPRLEAHGSRALCWRVAAGGRGRRLARERGGRGERPPWLTKEDLDVEFHRQWGHETHEHLLDELVGEPQPFTYVTLEGDCSRITSVRSSCKEAALDRHVSHQLSA